MNLDVTVLYQLFLDVDRVLLLHYIVSNISMHGLLLHHYKITYSDSLFTTTVQ